MFYSGVCLCAKPPACLHGVSYCGSIADSRHAEKFAAADLWPASDGNFSQSAAPKLCAYACERHFEITVVSFDSALSRRGVAAG